MASQISFFVNGSRHVASYPEVDPEWTLLRYLRKKGLTGTKLGCGEGGCGACTVLVSSKDPLTKTVKHRTVNACLTPVLAMDGCSVTTIEGIGNSNTGLHPVQERIAKAHGSQCGFCTPGIAMSMYAMLRNNTKESLTEEVVEESFDGNLCRCTGYRPILDAAKSFVDPDKRSGCCGGGCCGGSEEKDSSTKSCGSKLASTSPFNEPYNFEENATPFPKELEEYPYKFLAIKGERTEWFRPTTMAEVLIVKTRNPDVKIVVGNTEIGIETKFKHTHFPAFMSTAQVPELNKLVLSLDGTKSLDTEAKKFGMPAIEKLLSTSAGALGKKGLTLSAETFSSEKIRHLDAASVLGECGPGLVVGGAVTLSALQEALGAVVAAAPAWATEGFSAMASMLKWFASTQIRNVASLAGNIATASPISDMNPILIALGAKLALVDAATQTSRVVPLSEFFLRYRVVDMNPTELILAVHVPFTRPMELCRAYKQARRRDDDISIVTAAFRLRLQADPAAGTWTVAQAGLGFGGMAPTTVAAKRAQGGLVSHALDTNLLALGGELLREDLPLPPDVPGGMSEYRRTLTVSFWTKFYVDTCLRLGALVSALDSGLPAAPSVPDREASAAQSFITAHAPVSHGQQDFEISSYGLLHRGPLETGADGSEAAEVAVAQVEDIDPAKVGMLPPTGPARGQPPSTSQDVPAGEPDPATVALNSGKEAKRGPVGQPLMHRSALLQCTGEAQYVDDIPAPPGLLHAALVLSPRACGTVKRIDASKALATRGVVAYYGHQDLPELGNNIIGPVFKDEEVFASSKVFAVGQPLGVVVAESAELAQRAANTLVDVEFDETDTTQPVLSIPDAIAAKSFHPQHHSIVNGDVEAAFAAPDTIVVEGEMKMGGQEHFYLETNATLAVPGEGNMSMTVHTSTQNTMKTQNFVASAIGLPANRVVAKVKRMGGGFGGKETRSVFVSCAAAVAARNLGRPVSLFLDRDVDMATTGQRHSFIAKYKASATRDGKVTGLKVDLYCNMGWSFDLTGPVMDRALFHVDNCYKIPNVVANGSLCRTNLPSNTAFRGFGGPQGLMVAETYMAHLAAEVGLTPRLMRERNLYKEAEKTHYDQPVLNNPLARMFSQLTAESEIAKREKAIEEFNASHRWVKRGIDVVPVKFGISFTAKFMNQGGALVHVYTDGTVLVSHGGTEMGQGLHTKVAQVAARAFGIPVTKVHIEDSASDKVPNASPTAASMSSDLYGMATLVACEKIQLRLVEVAQRMKARQVSPSPAGPGTGSLDEVAAGDEYLCGYSFQQVVAQAYFDRVNLSAQGFYRVPDNMCGFDWDKETKVMAERGCPFNYFTFGMAVSEVELDVLTGDLRVIRADILMDLGRSLNPAIDVGQIEGAFMQGLGLFTMEEFFWGDKDHTWVRPGHMFTKGPGAYKIPAFNDVPSDFRISLLKDAANPRAVHSSKAVGEPPLFLGCSVFWAAKQAVAAARKESSEEEPKWFQMDSPASSERLRMACADEITRYFAGGEEKALQQAMSYRPKGSW